MKPLTILYAYLGANRIMSITFISLEDYARKARLLPLFDSLNLIFHAYFNLSYWCKYIFKNMLEHASRKSNRRIVKTRSDARTIWLLSRHVPVSGNVRFLFSVSRPRCTEYFFLTLPRRICWKLCKLITSSRWILSHLLHASFKSF